MGLAVIPTDWTEGYIELCVQWPNSESWLAILRGQLVAPSQTEFWDKFTGNPDDVKPAIDPTFNQNLHLEECMFIPSGLISQFGGSTIPDGWLLCNGASISRATYADLFAAIGTAYGAGNGTTTFNIPDGGGRVIVGQTNSVAQFDTLGETGGVTVVTLGTGDIPSHNHTQDSHNHTQNSHNHTQNSHNHTQNSHTHIVYGNLAALAGTTNRALAAASSNNVTSDPTTATNQATTPTNQATTPTNLATTATNQATGGGGSHNNVQPFIVANHIIKT